MTIKYLDSKRISTSSAEYKVHSFTSSGTFAVTGSGDVEYLVVAGGGGGGYHGSGNVGGGGAGGYRTGTGFGVTAQNYTITVGAGGAVLAKGSDSVFDTITSTGGGAGAIVNISSATINDGGSGGGAGQNVSSAGGQGNTPSTTPSQGFNGGAGAGSPNYGGNGGGGAGAVGGSNSGTNGRIGGNGGDGLSSSITGTSVIRAGGGAGSSHNSSTEAQPTGGTGGGGNGSKSGTVGSAGTANTGSGGGGGGDGDYAGGAGGSGIVIIRYLTSSSITATGGTITTISEAETKPTNVQDNSILVEKDTGARFWYDGSAWTQELPVTSGLKLWLDASDSSTITTATGVSQWNDKSGQGNNVSQATTASQPAVISANQNGKDIIRFDGSNDVLIRSTYTGGAITQQVYTFIVCKMPSTANGVYGWVYDSDASSRHTFIVNSISSPNHQIYAGTALTGTSVDSTNFKLYSLLFNGSSSTLRRAKTNILSGNAGTANMNGIWLGSDNGGTTYNSNVEIAEILIYDAILSDTDRDNIESYLTNKWGLS